MKTSKVTWNIGGSKIHSVLAVSHWVTMPPETSHPPTPSANQPFPTFPTPSTTYTVTHTMPQAKELPDPR